MRTIIIAVLLLCVSIGCGRSDRSSGDSAVAPDSAQAQSDSALHAVIEKSAPNKLIDNVGQECNVSRRVFDSVQIGDTFADCNWNPPIGGEKKAKPDKQYRK